MSSVIPPASSAASSPIRRRRFVLPLFGVAASLTLVLGACTAGEPGASGDPEEGGTLVYATGDAEPTCLDPHVGGNYPQALAATQFLESLVSRDADGEIIPWLAESWQVSEDGLTWDFDLKP